MTTTPAPARRQAGSNTRLLLSIAAIAVACGLLNIPNAYLFNTLAVAAPPFLGLAAGVYALPAVLAQLAFRRGGVAILAELLAGLVQAPFVPGGIGSVSAFLFIGILFELPFAVVAYRYWAAWLHYLAAVFAALAYGAFWAAGGFWDVAASPLWVNLAVPGLLATALVLTTAIGQLVVTGLERAGVLRGLRPPPDRRTRARRRPRSEPPTAGEEHAHVEGP